MASQSFLRLDGIPGTSKTARYAGWIEALRASWMSAGGSTVAGMPRSLDVLLSFGPYASKLLPAVQRNDHIPSGDLALLSDRREVLRLSMSDIVITRLRIERTRATPDSINVTLDFASSKISHG